MDCPSALLDKAAWMYAIAFGGIFVAGMAMEVSASRLKKQLDRKKYEAQRDSNDPQSVGADESQHRQKPLREQGAAEGNGD